MYLKVLYVLRIAYFELHELYERLKGCAIYALPLKDLFLMGYISVFEYCPVTRTWENLHFPGVYWCRLMGV